MRKSLIQMARYRAFTRECRTCPFHRRRRADRFNPLSSANAERIEDDRLLPLCCRERPRLALPTEAEDFSKSAYGGKAAAVNRRLDRDRNQRRPSARKRLRLACCTRRFRRLAHLGDSFQHESAGLAPRRALSGTEESKQHVEQKFIEYPIRPIGEQLPNALHPQVGA
jgi:hypothetical protein